MNFVQDFFLSPSSDHLHLIKYIILLMYFIHIPFISLMIGGTFFSLFYRILSITEKSPVYERISDAFAEKLIFRKTAGIMLGVLPLFVLTFVEGQVFYDANISVVKFMLYTTMLVAIGITLLYYYEFSLRLKFSLPIMLVTGGLGLLFLLVGYFIFSSSSSLMLDPGRWAVVNKLSKLLFSWNAVARFLNFLTAAFAVSGAMLFFFTFNWKDTHEDLDNEYLMLIRKIGAGIALAFTLLQPVFIFWNIATLPNISLSAGMFAVATLVLFLIMLLSISLYKILSQNRVKLGSTVMALFIFVFVFMLVNDQLARGNSTRNHSALLVSRAREVENEILSNREQMRASSIKVDLEIGKQIYENQCLSCHRFDQKLVGPPYRQVLPKYANDQKALINFIRKPSKINPEYPAMPQLGLNEAQIKSVAAYLLLQLEKNQ